MKSKIACLGAGALAVGLIAAGCGGGGDDESLTKAEFLTKANAICKQGTAELTAAFSSLDQASSPAQQQALITDKVIPNIQDQVNQIEDLNPPQGDEDTVSAITGAAQSAIDKTKDDPNVLLQQSGQSEDPFAEANRLADAYGMKECAS